MGARGRGGRVFGHPVGEVGVETGSREGPATAGRTGADLTVADCVKRWLDCVGRLCGGGLGSVEERIGRPRGGSSAGSLSTDAGARVCLVLF